MKQRRFNLIGTITVLVSLQATLAAADPNVARPGRNEVRSQLRPPARFAGPRAASPEAFQVRYSLAAAADLSVTLLDFGSMPMRTFHLAAGQDGTRAGENTLTVWDGKDAAGREAPAGEYSAALSFRHADGSVENKRFRLVKP